MATILEVNRTQTSLYHPGSNRIVERIDQTLEDMVSKVVKDDWDTRLSQILLAYQIAEHKSTGDTPYSSEGMPFS